MPHTRTMATYQCEECDKILKKCNMKRHAQEVHGEGTSQLVYCDMCEYASNRQRDLERHTYKALHTPSKWQSDGGAKRTAANEPDPARKRLIVKLPKPRDPANKETSTETSTNEDEETRRRALYKIPLLKSRAPHTDLAELQQEGEISRAEETTAYHPPNLSHEEKQLPLEPPRSSERQQPSQHDAKATHSVRRERHRHSDSSRRNSIGTGTDPHVTSDAITQTATEKKKITLDEYKEKTTHSVEITYARDSTKVVLRNATGEWRTTIRDLNKLMADHIPSRDPVDINLRLDPYQTSTSTSFDTGHVGMPGAGYGTLGVHPDEAMNVSPPAPAADPAPEKEILYDHNCQG